ncbi:FecR family protein [Sphingomonas crusticola]|uniref:FecR family protein n=1 Tax=Sphingomonas crusticola TaxID=1697973 RepID=UPI000E26B387|nr:FecR domain-containing protein [Sphingomonas crusticola]
MSIVSIRRTGSASATAETAAFWVLRQERAPLSELEEERFAAWLAEDLAHVEAYENAIWALDAAAHHAGEAPIRQMRDAALAARDARRPRRWLSAAGGALAASLAALWLFLGLPGAQRPHNASSYIAASDPNNATYRTQIGERLTVTLPDQSLATIDTNSELRVAYSATERRLTLTRGQALFEVAHGRPTPFRVAAGGREIVAVGTVFNVRIKGSDVRVALLDGTVRVRPATDRSGETAAEVTMHAGETLQASATGRVAVQPADVGQVASWRGGDLVFNDAKLADAVAEINRYTRRPIRIESNAIIGLRISGVFRTNDPERFSQAITEVLPVDLVRHGDGVLSLRARQAP